MANHNINYKFTYNTETTDPLEIDTRFIDRRKNETTVIRTTPNGKVRKQVFGDGKVTWKFSFPNALKSEYRDFFQGAYDAMIAGYTLTLSEENDSATYTDYTVILNLPSWSPEYIGATALDRDLSVEVMET